MKKILLIGGNGVLGSTYVKNFTSNKNYKLAVIDINNSNIRNYKNFLFFKTDISKLDDFKKKNTSCY